MKIFFALLLLLIPLLSTAQADSAKWTKAVILTGGINRQVPHKINDSFSNGGHTIGKELQLSFLIGIPIKDNLRLHTGLGLAVKGHRLNINEKLNHPFL